MASKRRVRTEYNRMWHDAHRAERNAYSLARYHRRKLLPGYKEKSHLNYLKRKQAHAEHGRKWRLANPDKIKALKRRHYLTGKVKIQLLKRKAIKKLASVEDCSARILLLHAVRFCRYCYAFIQGPPTIDHVIPLTRGGKHAPSNLVASCLSCNCSKSDLLVEEWQGRRAA